MRSVLVVTYLAFFAVFYLPVLLVAYTLGFISKKRQYNFTFMVGKHWSKMLILLAGTKVNVRGLDNIPDGAVLFVGNHYSWYDIPLICSNIPRPATFVAKKEMEKVPVISLWMKCGDTLFLDRNDIKEGLKTIIKGAQKLKNGMSIVIFPQGTRCKEGDDLPFKKGSLKLAEKSGVPIIPIAIKNSADILENNNLRIKRAKVEVIFGKPIILSDLDAQEKKFSAKYVQDIINTMLISE